MFFWGQSQLNLPSFFGPFTPIPFKERFEPFPRPARPIQGDPNMKLSAKIVTLLLGLVAIAGTILAKQSDALSSLQDFGGSLRVTGWLLPLFVLLTFSLYRLACQRLSTKVQPTSAPPFHRIRYFGRPLRHAKRVSTAPSWQKA